MTAVTNKRILVTGGAGYIGSHTCKALAAAGYEPIVYDNLIYGHEWAVQWGHLEKGDILDRVRLDQVITQYQPVAVMHFAAFSYVGESVRNPLKYYHNNVQGSLTLIEAAVAARINYFIFSSTCSVYGIPGVDVVSEAVHPQPVNPYGASKLMVERILADVGLVSCMRSVVLRYFNAAGTDPDGMIGEDHDPETHLIPLTIKASLGQNDQLTVFGSDYPTPDGTCIRDYVHVVDIADAHVLALQYLMEGGSILVANLGTGQGNSVMEIVKTVECVSGTPTRYTLGERRAGDPPRLVASYDLAAEHLGWRPRHSDLKPMLRTAFAWETRNR